MALLTLEKVTKTFGGLTAVDRVSLTVESGEAVGIVGPNGAGKTTTLRAILGTARPWHGRITYRGREVTALPPHKKVEAGMVLVPEGRRLFPNMTVRENLRMGAYLREARDHAEESLELVYSLFPILRGRAAQQAGTLSGGEQQMLSVARGLMARPKLMMLDEPSQGLAPKLVAELFATIERMREERDLTILLVEQNVEHALEICDYAYILHEGRVKAEGTASEIRLSVLREAYLGI